MGAVTVVTAVRVAAGYGAAIYAQVLGFVEYFVRLAHRVWKELRMMSLRELVRTLLILVTEKLERDMTASR
eukprot:39034-Eustigmatos_ZCMA.PRE.1